MCEVSQVEHNTILRNGFPPAANKFCIHFLCVFEGPVAEAYGVLVAEVSV